MDFHSLVAGFLSLDILIQVAVIVFLFKTLFFILALITDDNSVVSIGWGLGMIMIAVYTLFYTDMFFPRHILVTSLVLFWGLRLSSHMLIRRTKEEEDFRYRHLRLKKTFFRLRSYFQIFIIQGFLMIAVAFPVILINTTKRADMIWSDWFGAGIWAIGFIIEIISDFQLERFRYARKNRRSIMDKGLWKYSRHPNYFGEILIWWGIYIIALSLPHGWISLISPVIVTYLITNVTGIPPVEAKLSRRRRYRQYMKKTSALVPFYNR